MSCESRKTSPAYQLEPMPAVELVQLATESGSLWAPVNRDWCGGKEVFVYGTGMVNLTPKMERRQVPPLPSRWTAAQLQNVHRDYGLSGAMSMLRGWSASGTLYDDRSYGLRHTKAEIANLCMYGSIYDDFTDKVQEVGDRFIASLLEHGFRFTGSVLWYGDDLVFDTNRQPLHPLMYVEHAIHGYRTLPLFDSVALDDMLIRLLLTKYWSTEKDIGDRIVSVRDRIAELTTADIADDIGKIFEWRKVLDVTPETPRSK